MLRVIETDASYNRYISWGQRAQDLCHGYSLVCQVGSPSSVIDIFSNKDLGLDPISCGDQAEVDRSVVLRDGFSPKDATVVGFKADQLSPGE